MSQEIQTILLVEEDPTLAEITAFRLELLGYDVVKKDSAKDALAWLGQERPSLIIVDQFLTDTTGIELLNRLSNDMRTGQIPVLFVSTNADLEDVQKAYNAGANDYLVTPYDPAVLEEKIERLAGMEQIV